MPMQRRRCNWRLLRNYSARSHKEKTPNINAQYEKEIDQIPR